MGTDGEWRRIGRDEPFYGVLTHPDFRSENLDEAAVEKFWASGERRVESIFSQVEAWFGAPFQPESALDFGCGVGRILVPLAARCRHACGIDVSPDMLEVAQKRASEKGLDNLTLTCAGDASGQASGAHDFVHSFIVLQHIWPRRGYRIVDQLLNTLRPGGMGVLHLTYRNPSNSHWQRQFSMLPGGKAVANWIAGNPAGTPLMMMNEYNLGRIFARIQSISRGPVHAEFTDHGVLGLVVYFRKDRPTEPSRAASA